MTQIFASKYNGAATTSEGTRTLLIVDPNDVGRVIKDVAKMMLPDWDIQLVKNFQDAREMLHDHLREIGGVIMDEGRRGIRVEGEGIQLLRDMRSQSGEFLHMKHVPVAWCTATPRQGQYEAVKCAARGRTIDKYVPEIEDKGFDIKAGELVAKGRIDDYTAYGEKFSADSAVDMVGFVSCAVENAKDKTGYNL